MSLVADFLARLARTVTAYAGDETLMQAAVSASANVIVADGEMASEEFETAVSGVLASPILEKGYDALMVEEALYDAIGRARTRAGRLDNLRRIEAIAGRPGDQRESVFLLAVDVADHDGIAEIEHIALTDIAKALIVDKQRLLEAVPAKPTRRQTLV